MNRYFRISDEHSRNIEGFEIPPEWWSRPYEYTWAKSQIKPGETVVDAGCGMNHPFVYILARYSDKVYAVDIDVRVKSLPETANVEYVHADLLNTGLPDESIETVYCISVIEHLGKDHTREAMKEFYRILKPGGRAVITLDITLDPSFLTVWIKHPQEFIEIIPEGFDYGETDVERPEDLLVCKGYNLCTFRMVLHKP
ncbi:MAG: class I SAM-dependent methyltransferase [Firmicutes bacterium]|nr:class I SAM-dependent methyltransferase [Bacillota bacterium]